MLINILIFYSQSIVKFSEDFFDTVIQVNLTVLLVLTTLYVRVTLKIQSFTFLMTSFGISTALPQTGHIKMIDVWLLFDLIVPFTLIVLHTFMDYLKRWNILYFEFLL